MSGNKVYKFSQLVLVFLVLFSCSAQLNGQKKTKSSKKKSKSGKSSGFNNKYQDLTTRYNGYFNAKILLQQSLLRLEEQHKDEFNDEMLDVLTLNDSDKTSAVAGDMETILKKASTAIQKHPNAKWVDDCYLLMGKAYFLKGDYEEATKSFQFINNRFKRGIRKTDFQKRVKNKREKKGIQFNIGGLSNEDGKIFDKEERAKKNEEKKKANEDLKKERENEAEKKRKDREKEIADRNKEREALNKQRAKDRKELLKEREKIKKQREVERKRKIKWKEKNRKRRAKGQKSLPYVPKYTFEKKEPKTEEKKEEEVKEEKIEETKEPEKTEEEVVEEEVETKEETAEEDGEFSNFILKDDNNDAVKDVKYNDRMFSFLLHQPAKYESVVWLARSYMAMGNTEDAITSLDYIRQDKNMPRKHRSDLNGLYAQYHLDKGETQEAYNYLDLAIQESRKKSTKARYHYVQAQISEGNDDYKANVASLKKVLKSRPSYDMAFNAKLDIARNQIKSGAKSPKESIKYLQKMLKDDKHFDNQDQIYMAMADIAIEDGDIETAFEYLKKATENSTVNNEAKAKAYLKIAEMYYTQEEYLLSSAYYDSSLVILPKTFPNYSDIVIRKDVLAELAGHINTVELQDSLLRLVAMPEALRNDAIDELIEQIERQAEEEAEAASVAELQSNDNKGKDGNSSGGTFYFYSDNARSLGKIDFIREWGDRPNVDNWRRAAAIPNAKSTVADSDEQNLKDLALGGQLSREMFLNALPFSKEAQAEANKKIEESLYQIAVIYNEGLSAYDKAIVSYDKLLNRYPKTEHGVESHYALYQLLKAENKIADANRHKVWLSENAADSEYAKLVNRTGKENETRKNEVLAYYETTYQLFEEGNYNKVIERKKEAEVMFASNSLQPEFDLLEAYVIGSTNEVGEYVSALQTVAKKHKGTDVQAKADEILSYLEVDKRKNKEAASKFKFDEKQQHYFLVVLDGYSQNITKAINNISDFNKGKHASESLKVTQMLLDKDHPIILIKNFKNKTKSDLYTKSINAELANALKAVEVPYEAFSISKPNFNTFFKDKNTDAYLEFYKTKY